MGKIKSGTNEQNNRTEKIEVDRLYFKTQRRCSKQELEYNPCGNRKTGRAAETSNRRVVRELEEMR